MIFTQMLEIVALNDLASMLCARKFSFVPPGVDLPRQNTPFLAKMVLFGSPDVFRLRKEPINSLSYVRTTVRSFVPVLQP